MKLSFGPFVLDTQARQLTRAGSPVHLSPKAFDVLTLLVEQRPAVVEKAVLRERLWPGVHVVDAALTNLVVEIRGALREKGAESPLVRTVHGVGYAFSGEATTESGDRATERSSPVWLIVNDRPIGLSPGEHIIGREVACSVWVDSDGVSRRHALIRVPADAGHAPTTIEDLASTNGTYVQERRVTGETRLENGDRIQLGDATLVFRARKATDVPTKRVRRRQNWGN